MRLTYIDFHGVLVDFVGAVNELYGVDIYADKKNLGNWHAPSLLPDFYNVINNQDADWWASHKIIPNARVLIQVYKPDAILSTLWGNAVSYEGVTRILAKEFPDLPVIFTDHKHLLAKGNTLIDDKDENIEAWRKAGGIGILNNGVMNSGWKRL